MTFLQTLILKSKYIFPTDPKYKIHHKIKIYKNKKHSKKMQNCKKKGQKTSTTIVTEEVKVVIPCQV